MKVLIYRVELIEPVLVTALAGDPNSAVAYDYLPGGVVRGAVSHAYIRENGAFDAASDKVRPVLFESYFLNAYVVIAGQRALPLPISWQREKDGDPAALKDAARSSIQGKASALKGYFVPRTDGALSICSPPKLITVHIQRARTSRKNDLESRAVYRYEALAAGQVLQGAILCPDAASAQDVRHLLDRKEMTVGGARSAGYGRVHFTVVDEKTDWRETEDNVATSGEPVTFTLLSDAILRNEYGEYDAGLPAWCRVLAVRLESKAFSIQITTPEHVDPSTPHVDFAALERTLVGGFNRKWGLPLPQTPAISKGSVLLLYGVKTDRAKLLNLEATGIGERRAEGFGRIAVNFSKQAVYRTVEYPEDGLRRERISDDMRRHLLTSSGTKTL